MRVEKALAATKGVQSFQVDLTQGMAEVTGDPDPAQIITAINHLGYETILQPAS
jgi:copper chaperone CopZ